MDRWPFNLFYIHSLPSNIEDMEKIASSLGCDDITVEMLWYEMVSCFSEYTVPHMGNVYASLLFQQIQDHVQQLNLDLQVDWYINGEDTHLYINQEKMNDVSDFEALVEQQALHQISA